MKKKNSTSQFKKKAIPTHFQSKYEEQYFKSIQGGEDIYDSKNVISKYLTLEDTNPSLQRLKQRFGDKRNAHHLKSVNESMIYKDEPVRPALDPSYNIIKNGEQYSKEETIVHREMNQNIHNKLDRFNSNRKEAFQSQITTLPGPESTLRIDNRGSKVVNFPVPSGNLFSDNISTTSSQFSVDQHHRRTPMAEH